MNAIKYIMAFSVCSLLLSGCASKAENEAKNKFFLDKEACEQEFPKQIGNYYKLSMCLDKAFYTYAAVDPAYYEQAAAVARARDPIYKDIDDGKVSPADGESMYDTAYQAEKARFMANQRQSAYQNLQRQSEINSLKQSNCTYTSNGYGSVYQHCY